VVRSVFSGKGENHSFWSNAGGGGLPDRDGSKGKRALNLGRKDWAAVGRFKFVGKERRDLFGTNGSKNS